MRPHVRLALALLLILALARAQDDGAQLFPRNQLSGSGTPDPGLTLDPLDSTGTEPRLKMSLSPRSGYHRHVHERRRGDHLERRYIGTNHVPLA